VLAASAPFAAMVEGVEQRVEWLLTMALTDAAGDPVAEDVNLALESCRIEAQSQTDVPDQVRMQSGFPTIAVTFTLSGYVGDMSAADFFRRWNRDSPLWLSDALNAKVTVDIGLLPDGAAGTPELIRKGTVFVDSYSCKADGTVEFDCVDKAALLRAIPSTRGLINIPPYNMGGTSEFLIDSALRAVTRDDPRLGFSSTWPDLRRRCVFAAGMRSSVAPEVGGVHIGVEPAEPMKQPKPTFGTGVFGSALRLVERERFIPNQPTVDELDSDHRREYSEHAFTTASTVGDDVFCEFWFGGDVPAAADGAGLNLWIGTAFTDLSVPSPHGGVQVSISSDRIRVATVGDPGHHDWNTSIDWSTPRPVALQLNWPVGGGSLTGTIEVDGTTHTITPITATRPDTGWSMIRMSKSAPGQRTHIEAFQVSTETAATPSYHSFAPSAVLDKSLNPLLGVVYLDGDTRQFFDDINTAEFAVGGFWEDGVYRTLNRKTIANAPVARSVTSAASLLDLTEANESAAVINHARVSGFFSGTESITSPVQLNMGGAWRIRARATSIRTFTASASLWDINPTVRLQRDDEFYPGGASGNESTYLASADPDGLAPHGGGLTITVKVVSPTRVRVTVRNRSNQDAWLVAPATHVGSYSVGSPSLYIGGGHAMFLNGPDTVEWSYPDDPTAGRFGDCLWEASGNSVNYIQDSDAANQLAVDVVTESYLPRPNLTGVAVVPDPRVQIADTIHLVDPDVTGVDDYARVFGWTLEFGGGQWDMTIDTRVLAPPGGWLLGYPGRSELGSTAYLMGA
jgi:hypothetical protein